MRQTTYNLSTGKMEQVLNKPVRIANVRRRGNNKYQVVGMGILEMSFNELKKAMIDHGFTGYFMFGKKNVLS